LHSWRERKGAIKLAFGGHGLRLEMFEKGGHAGMSFRYRGPDTRNRVIVVPQNAMLRAAKAGTKGNGLKEEAFYFGQSSKCQNLGAHKPNMVRTVKVVNYGATRYNWPGFGRRDHFAVRWTGSLILRRSGAYRFYLISDDGSRFFMGNSLLVSNDGLHGMRKREGQRRYKAGRYPVRLEMFERGGGAGMIFRYKGPDTGNRVILVPASALKTTVGSSGISGIVEKVFYFRQGGHCQSLAGRKPNMQRIVRMVNYGGTSRMWPGFTRSDMFAVRWTGVIIVTRPGSYKWSLISDDGSRLWIDGSSTVNNDGLHGMRNVQSYQRVRKGPRKMRLEMFERHGHAGIIFRYQGPDTGNKMVSVQALKTHTTKNTGMIEQVFYFTQGSRCQNLNSRLPNMARSVRFVNYPNTGRRWSGFARSDHFAVRWSGSLNIKKTGHYKFSLVSDDGSKLFVNGAFVVNNDGLHGWRSREGTKYLAQGQHPLLIEFFERGGHAGISFRYKGADTRNNMVVVPQNVLVKVGLSGTHGLREAQFYFNQGKNCPDLSRRKPNIQRIVKSVNYPKSAGRWTGFARADHFAVRWTGSLLLQQGGTYRFSLISDDGSKLWVDHTIIVNNDGLHAWRNKEAQKNYGSGPHAIRIEMFEKGGHAGIMFRYKGSDTGNRMIAVPPRTLRRMSAASGLRESVFYFGQRGRCSNLNVERVCTW
jgi:hypothetical protein